MKIGIDGRMLEILADKAGLYQYIVHLIGNLTKIEPDNEYRVLSGFRSPLVFQNSKVFKIPGKISYFCLDKLRMPAEWLIGKVNVFHGPCFYLPKCRNARKVVTIHDLMAFRHPEFLSVHRAQGIQKQIVSSVKSADAIIAISEYTKRDIESYLGVSTNRIKVIRNGINERFRMMDLEQAQKKIKNKYSILTPYILFVGNIEPKKNIPYLIRAFALLRERFNYPHKLVLAGNKGSGFIEARNLVFDLSLEEEVLFIGRVQDDDLPSLYRAAELFVFPSLFEGFGMPVIEAMACGTPVISTFCTALPEILDDAAVYFDPKGIEDLVEKIHYLLRLETIKKRYIEKGLARAKMFSWNESAKQTLKLYREIL